MNSTVETAPVPTARRRRRASAGGLTLKLEAPKREGYVRRFVKGEPSRINQLEELGYTVVSEKAGPGQRRTDGLGSRITRHGGKNEDGQPFQMVLMETPASEYAVGVAEKEERLKPFEEALRRGDDPTGSLSKGELYDVGRSTINNSGA